MDLKAALTERFVWRKHNRDWRVGRASFSVAYEELRVAHRNCYLVALHISDALERTRVHLSLAR